jgi:hypothetical protein
LLLRAIGEAKKVPIIFVVIIIGLLMVIVGQIGVPQTFPLVYGGSTLLNLCG